MKRKIKKTALLTIFIVIVATTLSLGCIDDSPASSELIKANNTDEMGDIDETDDEPGFEAVFAVAGLLSVAYFVLRQRE